MLWLGVNQRIDSNKYQMNNININSLSQYLPFYYLWYFPMKSRLVTLSALICRFLQSEVDQYAEAQQKCIILIGFSDNINYSSGKGL